jgi:membrane associated rhomboid family serine protease/Zn-finger nucleic acid-binding protein
MQLFSCASVVVDKCPQCQGIWFDAHELGVFRDTLQGRDLQPLKILGPDAERDAPTTLTIRACPRDGEVLTAFTYSYNSKVRLNRCDRCSGIWSPFVEIIHLVEYAKLSQAIEPHVRALGRELLHHHATIARWRAVESFGETMSTRISYPWGYWDRHAPWWRQTIWLRPFGIILPLGTDRPVASAIYGTYGLVLLNLAAFVACRGDPTALAMTPREVFAGHQPLSMVSALFSHAGFLHLFGNLFYFWLFGSAVETRLGLRRFLGLYFATGLAVNAIYLFTHPSSMVPVLGASGAVSGILGAYVVLFPSANVRAYVIQAVVEVPAWMFLGIWFLIQFFFWVFSRGEGGGMVYSAHLFGFILGFIVALIDSARSDKYSRADAS